MSAVWIPQPSRGSLSADFAKFFRKHVNAAEPDFEVEPVTESPDAVYEKEKKKVESQQGNQKPTHRRASREEYIS